MAGKRQHCIPRLLQRGFLADPTDEAERTWLHRPGVKAKLVGIRDVGVEDWFYSRKAPVGQRTLDQAITDYERDLAKDVQKLREAVPGTVIESSLAAHTLVHLVMRTAHLRRTISGGVSRATSEIQALFTNPERVGAMLGVNKPVLAALVLDGIKKNAAEMAQDRLPAPLVERWMAFFARELGDQLAERAAATLGSLFSPLLSQLATNVRETHNASLGRPLDDNGRIAALTALTWSIEAATDLLLPDSVALARTTDGVLTPLLFTRSSDAAVVMLPLAHNRILIGRRHSTDSIDTSGFNAQAAASCEGFFIGSRSFDVDELNALIGTQPGQVLERSIAEAIRKAEEGRSLATSMLPTSQPREFAQLGFSYSVTLHDFGDELLTQEYGQILQAVCGAMARALPLHELDGITIAVDYHDALAKLNRGDTDLPPATSGTLDYGTGVAKPVAVSRDGKRKEHLVVDARLAVGWTSHDPDVRSGSLHILVKMLAGIAHSVRYGATAEMSFSPDAMARELHHAVATTPIGYWSARQAAFIAPNQGQAYADLVMGSLESAEREIKGARERMADGSDVGEVCAITLRCGAAVLTHAADWLGHRDGLAEGQPYPGSNLAELLTTGGLDRWIELFGRDLAACYTEENAVDLTVVTTLSPMSSAYSGPWAFIAGRTARMSAAS